MADKRNIVLVINDLKGNGAERVVITLATGFTEAGHRASIVCFKDHIELPVPQDIPVHIFSEKYFRWIPRPIRGWLIAPRLDRFILKKVGTPSLVLSNLMPADRIMGYSKLANVRFIIHSTTSSEVAANYLMQNSVKELKERKKLYLRKPAVCVSRGVEKDLRMLLGNLKAHETRTIYNPVDIQLVTESAKCIANDIIPNAILHVGKFNQAKRQDRLIRAYHAAKCKYPLVFIGTGPRLHVMKNLAFELGLNDQVHFLGFRKNPYPYIKAARLLVLCSDFEGLGMVLLEALVLETASISTDCKSGPSEILPQKNLCSSEDLNELVQLLNTASLEAHFFKSKLSKKFNIQTAISEYLKLSIY
jgi:glycosyltransferase involved in cell wall biosynthesis